MCEFSGVIRDAFIRRGHDAVSIDLLPTESPGPHIQGDAMDHLDDGWDAAICHPPCTDLAVSGALWFKKKREDGRQQRAIDFFMAFINAPIPKIGVEQPISIMSTVYRKPDQIIQPWQFGHESFKATCLWLKNLPLLVPTNILTPPEKGTEEYKRWSHIHREPPGPNRWKNRSRTFVNIADAMADQWS